MNFCVGMSVNSAFMQDAISMGEVFMNSDNFSHNSVCLAYAHCGEVSETVHVIHNKLFCFLRLSGCRHKNFVVTILLFIPTASIDWIYFSFIWYLKTVSRLFDVGLTNTSISG